MAEPAERAGRSGGARWAIALVGLIALVVAFLVLSKGGDDNTSSTAGSAATQQQQEQPAQQGATQGTTTQPPAAAPSVPTIRVKGGKPVGGVRKIEVRKGERLRFRVLTDAPDEVHLHGYDVEKAVAPGRPARFDLKATIDGRFDVELHESGAQIAQVDVNPS
jgi:FtsP/CotA-like multicopper oxidase with cupredoxin domain